MIEYDDDECQSTILTKDQILSATFLLIEESIQKLLDDLPSEDAHFSEDLLNQLLQKKFPNERTMFCKNQEGQFQIFTYDRSDPNFINFMNNL